MIASSSESARTSAAYLSVAPDLPILGPGAPAFELEKKTGSVRGKSFASSIRSPSTDPTMPRHPTKPTLIIVFSLDVNPAASRQTWDSVEPSGMHRHSCRCDTHRRG